MSSTANTTSQDTTIVVKSKLVEILVGPGQTGGLARPTAIRDALTGQALRE